MVKFIYNNTKNTSTGYTPFKLHYGYYPCVSYEKDIDLCSKSKSVDQLSTEP